eukprot:scaffold184684_cov27-Tisochrysis_lutea.AAC.1
MSPPPTRPASWSPLPHSCARQPSACGPHPGQQWHPVPHARTHTHILWKCGSRSWSPCIHAQLFDAYMCNYLPRGACTARHTNSDAHWATMQKASITTG